jgi:hypothetical protein
VRDFPLQVGELIEKTEAVLDAPMSVSTVPISLAPDCCATFRIFSMLSTALSCFPDARDLGQEIASPRVDEQAPVGDITDIAIPALGPATGRAGALRDRHPQPGAPFVVQRSFDKIGQEGAG